MTNTTFFNLSCPIMSKCLEKTLWLILRYKILLLLGKGIFGGKLTNTTIFYLLCPIMLQCLKKYWQIMRYKVLKFWAKLDTNHPLTPTREIFVYFRYPITILQCFKKNHWSGSQNTRLHNFWTNWPEAFFGGKIDYSYFCQSSVPHHTYIFKLKNPYRES